MKQIVLPRSGWRFVQVERQPDAAGGIEKDPQRRLWRVPSTLPTGTHPLGGVHVVGNGKALRRKSRSAFFWGSSEGTVRIQAAARFGRRKRLPVHRLGATFWVAESAGAVRRAWISVEGGAWQPCDNTLVLAALAGNRQRRRVLRRGGVHVEEWTQ